MNGVGRGDGYGDHSTYARCSGNRLSRVKTMVNSAVGFRL